MLAQRTAGPVANGAGPGECEQYLEAPIRVPDGLPAVLRLTLPVCATAAERSAARQSLDTVAAALSRLLHQRETD